MFKGRYFWPPETRSTQCINWLPPSAPCSWDVTFRMATTCVISRIESKQIQHSCLAKTLLSSWYFRKNPRICSRCFDQNLLSATQISPGFRIYFCYFFRLYHGPSPSPHGASASWIGAIWSDIQSIWGLCHDMIYTWSYALKPHFFSSSKYINIIISI